MLLAACSLPSADDPSTTLSAATTPVTSAEEELYKAAVYDSMEARSDEIRPLVNLTRSDPLTTWNDKGRVLLLSLHSHPDSYRAGQDYVTSYGAVWTFTDKEIAKWVSANSDGVTNWTLRLKQLVGVPYDRRYTHISAMWTNTADVKRPAFEPDISKQITEPKLADGLDPAYEDWFSGNIIASYENASYPWTRLGYTYDWSGKKFGLSEFLIAKDSTVFVEYTKTIDAFISDLQSKK